ncbi:MAG: hypothetical protein IT581_16190 [Verrucomicrobiales bacterium]|nr:hypothetical protein [Verrucomicrobiales bacterium]
MKAPLNLLTPWEPIDPEAAEKYEHEYAMEIAKGHPLYGAPVRAIARRIDRDEVLFELLRSLCDYVVVNLTWSGNEENDRRLPEFELFLHDEVMDRCIRPAHEKYKG